MFIVRRSQIEAFRIPLREAAKKQLVTSLKNEGHDVRLSPDGKTLIQTDERGNQTQLIYSSEALPETIVKPSGVRYGLGHDAEGKLSTVKLPGGENLHLRFEKGQLRQAQAGSDKTYQLDYQQGRLTRVVYPDRTNRQFVYDGLGNILAEVDRTGHARQFQRDPGGQLQSIVDPLGRQLRFRYDAEGLLSALEFPDGTRQAYEYDADTDTLYVQLRDGKAFYQQYENNQITGLTWQDGPSVGLAYGNQGELVSIEMGEVGIGYTYDDQQRLIAEQSPVGTTRFAYAGAAWPAQVTLPTGLTVDYEFDTDDRVIAWRAEGRTTRYVYDERDLLTEIRYANGLTEYQERGHMEGLRQVRVQNSLGQLVSEQQYAYDACDRLSRYDDPGSGRSVQLSYDPESRLTGTNDLHTGQRRERFGYDAKGNLIEHNGQPVLLGSMDEVRRRWDVAFEYDALGNLTRLSGPKGDLLCQFARNSTLASVRVGAETWQYQYDGIGRRIGKTNGTQTWRYGWAGSQMVSEEFSDRPGAASLVREYIYLPDSAVPVAFREQGQFYYLQADVRGAVTRVYDERGQVVWQASYSAFGSITIHRALLRQPWRLMGQYEDEETGLYYNLARYYCPWLTTYLSLDPEWLDSETCHYGYARNDPFNRADPLGNIAPLVVVGLLALGGLIGGGIAVYNKQSFWGGAVHGVLATGGGIIGATLAAPGIVAGAIGLGVGIAVGAFPGSIAEQLINNPEQEPCYGCALGTALFEGALGGLLGFAASKFIASAAGKWLANTRTWQGVKSLFGRRPPSIPSKPIAQNAIDELKNIALRGRVQVDIEADLIAKGFTKVNAKNGGGVWTKPMPNGETASVRIDPAKNRIPPKGWADEVPHAHKEVVSTSNVQNGNYNPTHATTLDEGGSITNIKADQHIPIN